MALSRRGLAPLLLGLAIACDDPEFTGRCLDEHTFESCLDDSCVTTPCRGDEICEVAACIPWESVDFELDFEITPAPVDPLEIWVRVTGNLPMERAELVRFDFGDGTPGHGSGINHTYAADGVYAVNLTVRLQGDRFFEARKLATVGDPLAWQSRTRLVVNDIPAHLDGSAPAPVAGGTSEDFHLLLPTSGFTVGVEHVGLTQLTDAEITANVAFGHVTPGDNLLPHLQSLAQGHWQVPADLAPDPGMVTLSLTATDDADGAHHHQLTFESTDLTAETDPFARQMIWLLRFDLDHFETLAVVDGDDLEVVTTAGGNGIPDFDEELLAIGARSTGGLSSATSAKAEELVGANAIYKRWIMDSIVAETYRYFGIAADGTPLDNIAFSIFHNDDPLAPNPDDFSPEGDFSMMRLGGQFEGALGWSWISHYNQERIDNTSNDRGVGTATILGLLSAISDEAAAIHPLNGVPVGQHPWDGVVLADTFDPHSIDNNIEANARYDSLSRIARFIGIAVASVTAHEIGHAMGLVPNDPPPYGFFAGRDDVVFMGASTNRGHAHFPPLSLMQAGGDLVTTVFGALEEIETPTVISLEEMALVFFAETRLDPYSRAYLQRRMTYRNFNGKRQRQALP